MVLFSIAYFPPASYMQALVHADKVMIECQETYPKQTYRNRCYIYSANGKLPLIVPVIKPNGNQTKTKDILISYEEPWQKNHARALESAYNASPYFLFYRDDIEEILFSSHELLVEMNLDILRKILELLGIEKKICMSREFVKEPGSNDLRNGFSPKKKEDTSFREYSQVFSTKHGFIPGLSILDLLFNLGPDSINHLSTKQSANY
ncbi:MAG: WbqC family protein [Bacteroidota bacterium]|nr:WbqC family protein [Bacteroidota bacterium]